MGYILVKKISDELTIEQMRELASINGIALDEVVLTEGEFQEAFIKTEKRLGRNA